MSKKENIIGHAKSYPLSVLQNMEAKFGMPLNVKFKKLHKDAITPKYAKPGDVGLDLTATSVDVFGGHLFTTDDEYNIVHSENENCIVSYNTGLAFELPEGYFGLIHPRSSIYKYDLELCNSIGVLDQQYHGPIFCKFRTTKKNVAKVYRLGNRICQLIILPYPQINLIESEELSETERGDGGFGSTGL